MTNMSQAPSAEKKGVSDILGFKIFGMPLPLYAFALITLLLSHFYNALPTDIVGGFAIMFIIGAVFGEIDDDSIQDYLGYRNLKSILRYNSYAEE